ncbi:centromere protein O isoform X2 [Gouania willdenowi]|uniref:centromere protein O isoform X2 n=1 Tax=Gouania willdenowi TaxID=441366 RepID=UPI001055960E|nr:centromere protein O isoform X2 [Gouania willdenowi]
MERASTKGVLGHLSLLETQMRSCRGKHQQLNRTEQLKAKVEALCVQKEQLKRLQKVRSTLDGNGADDEMDDDSENADILQLMAKCARLKDLLHAHHLIGGYDVVKTRQDKGLCITLTTAYEGIYLDTYHLEMDLSPKLRISRHDIPPFIPLNSLVETTTQTALRPFLDFLSQHLNAFTGRKQQLKLVKEQHKSVEVMESNVLCSVLVLLVRVPERKLPVLCILDYTDHSRSLPTGVKFECDDEPPNFEQWKKSCRILLERPVHKALITMKSLGCIV